MESWLLILFRAVLMFFITLAAIRIMGKRQPAKMNAFNLVNYIIIAVIAALISLNIIANFWVGLLILGVWVLIPIALDYLALKSKFVHDLLNGKEAVLIKQGKIMEENLFRVRLTGEELLRELRAKNVFSLNDVEFAVMETTGELNVLLKPERKPVTPKDLEWKVSPQAEPQTVILDGNILEEPLAGIGQNRSWLELQLENAGVSPANVFIGQVDSNGELYLDLFDDALILPNPKVRELLYANLEKSQAALTIFSLETQSPEAKVMYARNAEKLACLLEKLRPYLLR